MTQIEGNRNRLSEYREEFLRFAPDVIVDLLLSSEAQARQLMETVSGVTRVWLWPAVWTFTGRGVCCTE